MVHKDDKLINTLEPVTYLLVRNGLKLFSLFIITGGCISMLF